ncbi:hypothetical protein Dimus_011079 [Dionaea muscipula]
MGSKGRIPPPYMRGPHPALGMALAEPFGGPAIRPPQGSFPVFDMLPPPEIVEQKLAAQHIEMDKKEQQRRGLASKISKLEAELREAEHVKLELQQAHAEAQSLVKERQQLLSKVQQLTQDFQKAHADLQQLPALVAELDGLRQEYQHCRATFDYEKKLYNDHLETLQVMEKNYMTMAQEVEKLRADLNNTSNVDRRPGVLYGAAAGYGDNDTSRHPTSEKNSYEDSYRVPQGHMAQNVNAVGGDKSTPTYGMPQPGQSSARTGYDIPPRGSGYDMQRGANYDAPGGPAYNLHRGPTYGLQRPPTYDAQRAAAGYVSSLRAASYDAQPRGAGPSSGQVSAGTMPYGSS